jgi:hypothetical protein
MAHESWAMDGRVEVGEISFPIRGTIIVGVDISIPLFIGHGRPLLGIEPRSLFQTVLGDIQDVFILIFTIFKGTEGDREKLFTHGEEASKGDHHIGDPATVGVKDYFLDLAQAVAIGVEHIRADNAGRFYRGIGKMG